MLDEAFSPGDTVECTLNLRSSSGWSDRAGPTVTMICEAVVARTEETAEGYGTACDIIHYRILQPSGAQDCLVN